MTNPHTPSSRTQFAWKRCFAIGVFSASLTCAAQTQPLVDVQNWQPGQLTLRVVQNDPHDDVRKLIRQAKYPQALLLVNSFKIASIKPGSYTINISFMGYQQKIYNDIEIQTDKSTVLNVKMTAQTNSFETVKIVGKKKVVELDDAKSTITLNKKDIEEMNVRDVQEVVAIQAGVSKSPDGIQIRGARVYETSFNIDNISAQDPLAGTGFGVQVSSGSIGELELITGGAGAEHDGGTAGVISTSIKEGSDEFQVAGSWQRDNLGGSTNSGWNTDIGEFSFGGKIKVKKRKFYFFKHPSECG